jgi:hypothetical protein
MGLGSLRDARPEFRGVGWFCECLTCAVAVVSKCEPTQGPRIEIWSVNDFVLSKTPYMWVAILQPCKT